VVKKIVNILLILLFGVLELPAQKNVKKPDVHADFQFGSYPWSRTAETLMKEDLARQILVAYTKGWSIEKIAKELKLTATDVSRTADKLEDERLSRRGDFEEMSAVVTVVRERDFERMKEPLRRHIQELTKLLLDNWKDIETMVDSLEGAKNMPKGRVMYETVVSGMLLGGLMDAFYEDQTLMPAPRRRGKGERSTDRYFAWLVESNPEAAGKLRRELRESSGYRVITIGTAMPDERLNPDELRGKDTVLEDVDARKYRTFIGTFSRDKLLPYFKSRRSEFLKLGALLESGRDIAFADFFAWYYNTMANGVADTLAAERRITSPEKTYTYAVKAPQ